VNPNRFRFWIFSFSALNPSDTQEKKSISRLIKLVSEKATTLRNIICVNTTICGHLNCDITQSFRWLAVFRGLCRLHFQDLKIRAACSPETSVWAYKNTLCHNTENHNLITSVKTSKLELKFSSYFTENTLSLWEDQSVNAVQGNNLSLMWE
jgi:hypothetical protein